MITYRYTGNYVSLLNQTFLSGNSKLRVLIIKYKITIFDELIKK